MAHSKGTTPVRSQSLRPNPAPGPEQAFHATGTSATRSPRIDPGPHKRAWQTRASGWQTTADPDSSRIHTCRREATTHGWRPNPQRNCLWARFPLLRPASLLSRESRRVAPQRREDSRKCPVTKNGYPETSCLSASPPGHRLKHEPPTNPGRFNMARAVYGRRAVAERVI